MRIVGREIELQWVGQEEEWKQHRESRKCGGGSSENGVCAGYASGNGAEGGETAGGMAKFYKETVLEGVVKTVQQWGWGLQQ